MTRAALLLALLLLAGPALGEPKLSLSLLGMTPLSETATLDGVRIGGLSGLDYAPGRGWVFISDDRSDAGPARFYTGDVTLGTGAPQWHLEKPVLLRNADGGLFVQRGHGGEAADGESIRFVPRSGDLVWSTEGDAKDGVGPSIRRMGPDGHQTAVVPLPPLFTFDPAMKSGPRDNLSFEGLSFAPDGTALWLGMKAPFFQDGPLASVASGADVRFTRLEGGLARQYVYRTDSVAPHPAGRLADNGVSEILRLDGSHLLVLERSGIQQADGDFRYRIRLYLAGLRGAGDVHGVWSLAGAHYHRMTKTLLLNFDTMPGVPADNLEGMAWGPDLPDGRHSLVLIGDNNFSAGHPTQLWAFAVYCTGCGH